ncbi:MAG: serine/threonine-protein kinase [Sandaracinus sp.]
MPSQDDERPPEPQRFGPYLLVREIASGGMATVYEAVREGEGGFRRKVAVKRIHPHLARDRAFADMFLDEARIAARIAHPNVCQVLDYGRHQGESFLAMELLDGHTLSQLLSALVRRSAGEGTAHVPLVLGILAECAEGLHAAHELRDDHGMPLDVVHRDVSPQNLFVTMDGEVKVVDFGVATARDKNHRTETNEIKGKLAYMSPEQAAGRVDRRADVWALGVVLWEALTLRRLFRRGTQPETLAAVERDPIPRPSEVLPGLPPALDDIVMRALERDTARRTPDARTLALALHDALETFGGTSPRTARAAIMRDLFPPGAEPETAELPPTVASRRRPEMPAPAGRRWMAPLAVLGGLAALAIAAIGYGTATEPTSASRPSAPSASSPEPTRIALGAPAPPPATPPITEAAPPTEPPPSVAADPSSPPPRAHRAPVVAEPPPSSPPSPPATELAAPAELEGDGRVTVPMGVAVCFDRPCADRADALFGPRTLTLPGGDHRVYYVAFEGDAHGEATTTRTDHVVVTSRAASVVPRP